MVCWQPVDESGGSVLHMIVPFIETNLLEVLECTDIAKALMMSTLR